LLVPRRPIICHRLIPVCEDAAPISFTQFRAREHSQVRSGKRYSLSMNVRHVIDGST
jgi:hypothetical protein